MNPTNIDGACNVYPTACEIDPAAGPADGTLGASPDAFERIAEITREFWAGHSPEECGIDPVKVPVAQSYGGVLFSADGRFLLREPIGHLGGYVWTWPKGRPEKGESPAQTALREVYEETGYHARIIGVLPRVYVGTTRTNVFFLMEPVGEQGPVINETAQTRWVGYEEACRLITLNKHAVARNRDRAILDDALRFRPARKCGGMPVSVPFGVESLGCPSSAVVSRVEG